ncbi:beta-1,2-xylosyltransferase XYXT1-like isoform X1 [Typha latifolia]|uniref:beta-1,2-xylosyltransferase XYXT1-like isoform X1 n=1 Tax=Typha latifolia TaxID=4733 RepID=UPI003C2AFED1
MSSNTSYHHCSGALCKRSKENKDANMKSPKGIAGRIEARKLGKFRILAIVLGCLLLPIFFVGVIKLSLDPLAVLKLQLSLRTNIKIRVVEEDARFSNEPNHERTLIPIIVEEKEDNVLVTDAAIINLPIFNEEKESERAKFVSNSDKEEEITDIKSSIGNSNKEEQIVDIKSIIEDVEPHVAEEKEEPHDTMEGIREEESMESRSIIEDVEPHDVEEKEESHDTTEGDKLPKSKIVCDFSQRRSDTCVMNGDVRVLSQISTIILAGNPQLDTSRQNLWKVRPYARKWEQPVMEKIKELTLKGHIRPEESPKCSINHTVPAIVFSTGGFLGNFFHDFTDVLVPLFITSRQYNREVQFLVTNFNSRWIKKYQPILARLSHYEIINLDREKRVHCFPKAHAGLLSHKEFGIYARKSPNGHSMTDFRELLRESFSLSRKSVSFGTKKPRLVILYRKGSRTFMNKKEVVSMARRLGYKVILAGPEETRNLPRFARTVNSCDVMMGIHGAGLANMIFLPDNATLLQIVPWGGLGYACRHDFGDPASDMGIKYLEYDIKEEESSLIYQYPRDHPVFTDPLSIHKQGWNALWSVFLNRQNVNLDCRRFRGVLQEVLRSLR